MKTKREKKLEEIKELLNELTKVKDDYLPTRLKLWAYQILHELASLEEPEVSASAEGILENELNNIGFSFAEQLKPEGITLAEVRKTKKAIIKAMQTYAQQQDKELPDDGELLQDIFDKNYVLYNCKRFGITSEVVAVMMKEYASIYLQKRQKDTKPSYPEEFVKWIISSDFYEIFNQEIEESGNYIFENINDGEYYSFSELLPYWINDLNNR